MKRYAFTMLELIFVIVIMGIIGKFGTEFLAQAYKSFIFANVNNKLQSDSASAVEFIGARLQHRIKDSVIVRTGSVAAFTSLATANPATSYTVLEWVSSDIDGYRGVSTPNWSGIIDLTHANTTVSILESPGTNTVAINALIQTLSHGGSGINDAALYFIGSNNDISSYGWNWAKPANQTGVMHPINSNAQATQFIPAPGTGTFAGIDVYEYYKLAWTANAIVIEYNTVTKMGDLVFYYDYQPWLGEAYTTGKHFVLAHDISTFQAIAIGSVIKIQVCAKSDLIAEETYSLCKEKTIF